MRPRAGGDAGGGGCWGGSTATGAVAVIGGEEGAVLVLTTGSITLPGLGGVAAGAGDTTPSGWPSPRGVIAPSAAAMSAARPCMELELMMVAAGSARTCVVQLVP
mmetsp:Transcript_63754/g.179470  ORF Transcript_63754/g.179470 Transcript_63754/m.179470 type:complete len:105 (-) Transcript_63754:159-473(-)